MSADEHRLDELLGAYALDAVSDDERRAVDEYLRVNPRARQEVAEHREAAAMLAWSGMRAPEGLWDRIAGELDESGSAAPAELAGVVDFAAGSARRRARSRRGQLAWPAVLAVAASVGVLAFAGGNVVARHRAPQASLAAAADSARRAPGTRLAHLTGAGGTEVAEVVVDQSGHGYLVADALPPLARDHTYQLWGVVGDKVISMGVLGDAPTVASFSVAAPVSQVVLTVEVAGGVVSNGNPDGAFAGTLA